MSGVLRVNAQVAARLPEHIVNVRQGLRNKLYFVGVDDLLAHPDKISWYIFDKARKKAFEGLRTEELA